MLHLNFFAPHVYTCASCCCTFWSYILYRTTDFLTSGKQFVNWSSDSCAGRGVYLFIYLLGVDFKDHADCLKSASSE